LILAARVLLTTVSSRSGSANVTEYLKAALGLMTLPSTIKMMLDGNVAAMLPRKLIGFAFCGRAAGVRV
jgi:hypothetical protein